MNFDKIKTIFFDLDNTLFDHKRAERAALRHLMETYPHSFSKTPQEDFFDRYDYYNKKYWQQLAEGLISTDDLRIKRLQDTCTDLNIVFDDIPELSRQYFAAYSQQHFLIPQAKATLTDLRNRFELGLLTNGFTETQKNKLRVTGLTEFFNYKIYSEEVGALKPSVEIFDEALRQCQCTVQEVVLVGDSYESDIAGAKAAGWKAILFDPEHHFEDNGIADLKISELSHLITIK